MNTLSAIIITRNEEANIGACLERLRWCDEIVVVDSQSTDRTVEICRQHTEKVFVEPWQGYARQKNIALGHATGNWVLWVDADERVSQELAVEIKSRVLGGSPSLKGYRIPRRFFFLGRRIRFGGVGCDFPLRLFQRQNASFDETKLVHESVHLEGRIGKLKGWMDHYSYQSIHDYITRFDRYTTLAARELHQKGRRFHFWHLLKPLGELVVRLLLRGAVLDGAPGIAFACLSSSYVLVKYLKLREIGRG